MCRLLNILFNQELVSRFPCSRKIFVVAGLVIATLWKANDVHLGSTAEHCFERVHAQLNICTGYIRSWHIFTT